MYKLHTKKSDGTIETLELEDARKKAHQFLRPAISPEQVYAHAWKQGDLVIFGNRQVTHSVVSELAHLGDAGKRMMHQCNIASGADPVTII